jgi:hypothetical protein
MALLDFEVFCGFIGEKADEVSSSKKKVSEPREHP